MNIRVRTEAEDKTAVSAFDWIILAAWFAGILLYVWLIPTFFVNPDANYYLLIAREILRGGTPSQDIVSSYPPLVPYIFSLVLWVKDTFVAAAVFNMMIQLANAWLLFALVRLNGLSRPYSSLLSLIYFLFTLALDGFRIVLEPFQVFFALSAAFVFLRLPTQWFGPLVTGILIGCSMMSKQYSVFFAAGFLLMYVFTSTEDKASAGKGLFRLTLFLVGCAIPFSVFLISTDAELMECLRSWGFMGTLAVRYSLFGTPSFWNNVAVAGKVVLSHLFLFVPFAIYLLHRIKNRGSRLCDLAWVTGLLIMPIFFIRPWPHYVQLLTPWSFILFAGSLRFINRKTRNSGATNLMLIERFLVAAFLIHLPYAVWQAGNQIYRLSDPSKQMNQIKQAHLINQIFSPGSQVYVIGGDHYYRCRLFNPIKNYGFKSYRQIFRDPDNFPFNQIKNFIITDLIDQDERQIIRPILQEMGYEKVMPSKNPEHFDFEFFTKE